VVVDDDDPRPLGPVAQRGVDPAVVLAPDLALVEVGLGGVDGDDLGEALGGGDGRDRVAGAEEVLEVPVAHVAGVVVAHRDDHVRARELIQEAPALLELAAIALHREIAGDHHQIRRELVGLLYGGAQQAGAEQSLADVQVGHLDDLHVPAVSPVAGTGENAMPRRPAARA
jgi:hypothetical protein